MEMRFGRSFQNVRIHTGYPAEQAAHAVEACAFTTSSDIVFGAGQFQPGTTEGKRLLAHELAHVVQQGSGRAPSPATQAKLSVSEPHDPLEVEADLAASHVIEGRSPVLSAAAPTSAPSILRQKHDEPKKKKTEKDFTVENDHGSNRAYLIRFPHYITEEEAARLLFKNAKVPADIELEYEGPQMGGWTYKLRSKTGKFELTQFADEFSPRLASEFHPDVLSIPYEQAQERRKGEQEFMDSSPVYLGGQTVRDFMSLEHCKDHEVNGQIGKACWGERAGYFYWVGFDSYHRGTTLEVKSSPKTPTVIRDWEWFLSHSPADYLPHLGDLSGMPYAASFLPKNGGSLSTASFTLGEAEMLTNELSNYVLQHELLAWISVFQSAPGAVKDLTVPPPSMPAQAAQILVTGAQLYQTIKDIRGDAQTEFDLYLTGLFGLLHHGAGMIPGGTRPRTPTPPHVEPEPPPHPAAPGAAGAKAAAAHTDPTVEHIEATPPKVQTHDTPVAADKTVQKIEQVRSAMTRDNVTAAKTSQTAEPVDEVAKMRAAKQAKLEQAKAEAKAKIAAQAVQQQRIRAAGGGGSVDTGGTEVGTVETTVATGSGGSRTTTSGGPGGRTVEPAFPPGAATDAESVTQALKQAGFSNREIVALSGRPSMGMNDISARRVAALGSAFFSMEDLRALARYLVRTDNVLTPEAAQMLAKNVAMGELEGLPTRATRDEIIEQRTAMAQSPTQGDPPLRVDEPQPDLIGLGPALVHPAPLSPEEMFEILVNMTASAFNRGAAQNPPKFNPRAFGQGDAPPAVVPPKLGAGIGPAAGGRDAGESVFAVMEILDPSGRPVVRGFGQYLVDSAQEAAIRASGGGSVNRAEMPHAEQSALEGLDIRLGGHAPEIEGGELKVMVTQLPCGPDRANCSLALQQFADRYGLTLHVYVPQRPALNDPGTMVGPRAATMGSQTTGMPPVTFRELGPDDLNQGGHDH